MLLAFARQSAGTADFGEFSGERLVNLYPRAFPDGGRGPVILAPSPGLTPFATLAAGSPVRALLAQAGMIYAACGGRLWRVRPDGSGVTDLGAVPDDPATTLAGDGVNIAAAAGGVYAVWSGTALATIAPGVLGTVGTVTSLDGYTVVSERDGDKYVVSGAREAGSFNPLWFASAEGAPDYLLRAHADHSELLLFGTRSIEIWQNSGGEFPFARMSGGKLARGLLWPMSVVSEDNGVFFVGDDRVVYRLTGYTPSRVSTHAVEAVLRQYPATADVRAMGWTWEGHKCVGLRFPDRPAWVFDVATGAWHERATGIDAGPWAATAATNCDGCAVFGTDDGRLCRLGGLTDAGDPIMREAVSLPLERGGDDLTVHELELVVRTGAADVGRAASMMLQVSRDGGRTWGGERWRGMGALGAYDTRVRWQGLGQARSFQMRVRVTDPVPLAIYGARVRAS
jgi:hypothetical protein